MSQHQFAAQIHCGTAECTRSSLLAYFTNNTQYYTDSCWLYATMRIAAVTKQQCLLHVSAMCSACSNIQAKPLSKKACFHGWSYKNLPICACKTETNAAEEGMIAADVADYSL